MLRIPIIFRLVVPVILLITAMAAMLLAQYSGGLIEYFPGISETAKGVGSPPAVDRGLPVKRRAGRVVVVVVDGLAVSALREMPYLVSLGKGGARFNARTETPSYSRTGYSTLATGAGPEISGVSSNSFHGHSRIDSIFHRARQKGLRTAFVGYDWWLDLFEKDIIIASVDSGGINKDAAPFKTPGEYVRRMLVGEKYIRIADGDWRRFKRERKMKDRFGDPADTGANEDLLRAGEAARVLKKEGPDLIYVHLENTDYHGHATGSADGPAYRRAAARVDQALRTIGGALDLTRDVLVVTADHGFVTANIDAGHGGYEDGTMLIPLILHGAGVKQGIRGGEPASDIRRRDVRRRDVRQRDVAPTIAVLMGLAYPRMNQGRPIWSALLLSPQERKAAETRLNREQKHLSNLHLGHLKHAPLSRGDWRAEYREILRGERIKTRLLNLVPGILAFLFLFYVFFRAGLVSRGWFAWWLLYEFVFFALFLWRFNVYSMSMYASLNNLMAWSLPFHLVALFACVATRMFANRFFHSGGGVSRGRDVVYYIALGAFLKTAVLYIVLGNAALMPHGFWLFAGIAMGVQTLFASLTAIPIALLFGPPRSLRSGG